MVSLDIAAAFERRFAGMDSNILKSYVMLGKKGTLAAELGVLNQFHSKSDLYSAKVQKPCRKALTRIAELHINSTAKERPRFYG